MKHILLFFIVFLSATSARSATCVTDGELAHGIINGTIEAIPFQKIKDALIYSDTSTTICQIKKNLDNEDVVQNLDMTAQQWKKETSTIQAGTELLADNAVIGNWQNGENAAISFTLGDNDKIRIEGEAQYTNSSGAVSVGEFNGILDRGILGNNVAKIPSIGVDGAEANQACYLELRFIGSLLVVQDSGEILGSCGGYGATFSGIYGKSSSN